MIHKSFTAGMRLTWIR